jgi:dienelactone hydrolase
MSRLIASSVLLVACTEPLELPDDAALAGVPVGVATVDLGGHTTEVWYPATDRADGAAGESIDVLTYVPQSVKDVLGDVSLPPIETSAVRDADFRRLAEPAPVVVFSHGFGGMRVQSASLGIHLASRGYVVVSTDHVGRSLGDLLPCLFDPALDGCNLTGFSDDPGEDDVDDLLDALPDAAAGDGWLGGRIDPERIGLFGHSAGGATTTTVADDDDRIDAYAAMAGGDAVSRDVPGLFTGGTCDNVVPSPDTEAAATASGAAWLPLAGAGHLAFSDLCAIGIGDFYATYLEPRDDLNETFTDGLLALGTDGCPDGTPDPAVAGYADCEDGFVTTESVEPTLKAALTEHFDAALR